MESQSLQIHYQFSRDFFGHQEDFDSTNLGGLPVFTNTLCLDSFCQHFWNLLVFKDGISEQLM